MATRITVIYYDILKSFYVFHENRFLTPPSQNGISSQDRMLINPSHPVATVIPFQM
jgi:hypothetical protein